MSEQLTMTDEQYERYMSLVTAHQNYLAAMVAKQLEVVEQSVVVAANPKPPIPLRDWFAGQALAGYASNCDESGIMAWRIEDMARNAYQTADAMLAARGEK